MGCLVMTVSCVRRGTDERAGKGACISKCASPTASMKMPSLSASAVVLLIPRQLYLLLPAANHHGQRSPVCLVSCPREYAQKPCRQVDKTYSCSNNHKREKFKKKPRSREPLKHDVRSGEDEHEARKARSKMTHSHVLRTQLTRL